MPEIIEQYYAPLLKGHGFIPDRIISSMVL
mgnify:CR=1 FL=1